MNSTEQPVAGSHRIDVQSLSHAMLNPAAYPHPVDSVSMLETHISQIFLAGAFAYKVRKPVKLDFVDFSTLAARHADCEEEVRLNRRLAPDLYLGVVPITAMPHGGAVCVGGEGVPIEYAVRMLRFDQRDLLHTMMLENRIAAEHIDALADTMAAFHRAAPVADPHAGYGTPARVHATLEDCAAAVIRLSPEAEPALTITAMLRERAAQLDKAFESRLRGGHVRECHGDLHLGNVVLIRNTPTPFDCLEFSPALRWIDTINDAAFPFMDLLAGKRPALAYRLLNRYLERSADYAGLILLPFYAAMRALVRARVLLERAHQLEGTTSADEAASAQAQDLLTLALQLIRRHHGMLILMHGVSGSGKSTIAAQLAEQGGMIRVRTDTERQRGRPGNATAKPRYSPREIALTYRRLRAICKLGIAAGFPMIADATFLARQQRLRFHTLARRLGVPVTVVHCDADPAVLRARVLSRMQAGNDPSEAGLAVLEAQLRTRDPLTNDEQLHVIQATSAAQVLQSIARMKRDE